MTEPPEEQPRSDEQEERRAFEESMMPAVDLSDLEERSKTGNFDELAFELFKETAAALIVCASCYAAHSPQVDVSYPRNQAICIGLLVRLMKFIRAVLAILSTGDHAREVIFVLVRCLTESAISLRYLILKNDPAIYEEFVRTGLGPDAALYDLIKKNISERNGEILPIEERMLRSIERVCRLSKLSIDDINRKRTEWGGGLKNRLIDLGLEEAYVIVQRIPFHAVHGTWGDLVLHHLEEKLDGFSPRFETSTVDSRLLLPCCLFILLAIKDYAENYLQGFPSLMERVADLQERISAVNSAHEKWYQNRGSNGPTG